MNAHITLDTGPLDCAIAALLDGPEAGLLAMAERFNAGVDIVTVERIASHENGDIALQARLNTD